LALYKYDGSVAAATGTLVAWYGTENVAETMQGTAQNEEFWMSDGDRALGGGGDDTYYVNGVNLQVVELADGGADRVAGWKSLDLTNYANIENVTVFAGGSYAAGDAKDNVVEGGGASQQLYGGGGQDVLIGGAGADVFIVYKGEGNDVIQDFGAGEDVVRERIETATFEKGVDAQRQDLGDLVLQGEHGTKEGERLGIAEELP